MKTACYRQRSALLMNLPAYFTLAEFQQSAGISKKAAWQTCRQLVDAGLLAQPARGFYRQPSVRTRLPFLFHRAMAGRPDGYLTGTAALFVPGMWHPAPATIDLITRGTSRGNLDFPEGRIQFHRLPCVQTGYGLIRLKDGGRVFRMATAERVLIDNLYYPGRFLPLENHLELLLQQRRRYRQTALLELATAAGSEALARRLRVAARITRMLRLEKWLDESWPPPGRSGQILLQPDSATGGELLVFKGVRVNLPRWAELLQTRLAGVSREDDDRPSPAGS